MQETIDTPQSKTEDTAGRPIRYVTTVMFLDKSGGEWLRHEYIRLDAPIAYDKIVMEFEYLSRPKREPERRKSEWKSGQSQRHKIRSLIRKFNS